MYAIRNKKEPNKIIVHEYRATGSIDNLSHIHLEDSEKINSYVERLIFGQYADEPYRKVRNEFRKTIMTWSNKFNANFPYLDKAGQEKFWKDFINDHELIEFNFRDGISHATLVDWRAGLPKKISEIK